MTCLIKSESTNLTMTLSRLKPLFSSLSSTGLGICCLTSLYVFSFTSSTSFSVYNFVKQLELLSSHKTHWFWLWGLLVMLSFAGVPCSPPALLTLHAMFNTQDKAPCLCRSTSDSLSGLEASLWPHNAEYLNHSS